MSFTSPLRVEITQREVEGRTLAVLLEDFEYHVGGEDSDDVITAKAGFTTDFASVPRLFWRRHLIWERHCEIVLFDHMVFGGAWAICSQRD